MSNTAITSTGSSGEDTEATLSAFLPVDPFRSLHVHFGMLLGVDDFETMDAYHRGKMWLHNAWLHRAGTIWGLRVFAEPEKGEIRVAAGLAQDALGRELFLETNACLNVGEWFEAHRHEPELADIVETLPDGRVSFDAHVVILFKGCLARQVPALSEPCDAAGTHTAYSRIVETGELRLVPGPAPRWREPAGKMPYHRLRLLFALEEAIEKDGAVIDTDQEVLDLRADIRALPTARQPAAYLDAFRRLAAEDSMDMSPARDAYGTDSRHFPALDPSPVPLADCMEITLQPADSGWQLTGLEIDNAIRPTHVATATIQELLNGPLCRCAPAASTETDAETDAETPAAETRAAAPAPPSDVGGPRIDPHTVAIDGEAVTFAIEGAPLMKAAVEPRCFSVTAFDVRDGWVSSEIREVAYDTDANQVTLHLRDAPGGNLVRLIAYGTGPYPLLGRNRIPFAGAVDGPPGGPFNGNDFVYMFRIRSAT